MTFKRIRNVLFALCVLVILSGCFGPVWLFWTSVFITNSCSFWLMYQGNRTKKDVERLIPAVFSLPNWEEEMHRNLGDYFWDKHIWMRLTFRNPWTLYSPAVLARMGIVL